MPTIRFGRPFAFDAAATSPDSNFLRALSGSTPVTQPDPWTVQYSVSASTVAIVRVTFVDPVGALAPGTLPSGIISSIQILGPGTPDSTAGFSNLAGLGLRLADLIANPYLLVSGTDNFEGSFGGDRITLGAGNDVANGSGGTDYIDGGAGNDIIIAMSVGSTLIGGDGDDRITTLYGSQIHGGAGFDTLDLSLWGLFGTTIDFTPADSGGVVGLPGGGLVTGVEVFNVVGSGYADTLTLGIHGGSLSGGAGDDVLRGNSGNDYLSGGPGRDRLYAGAGDDIVAVSGFVQSGLDDVSGEIWEGGAGFDLIEVASNIDIRQPAMRPLDVSGFEGVSFGVTPLASTFSFAAWLYDRMPTNMTVVGDVAREARNGVELDIAGNLINFDVGEWTFSNWVIGQDFVRINGNSLSNTLVGSIYDDRLYGVGGDDVLIGGAGNDRLVGGAGIDRMYGGEGDDEIGFDLDGLNASGAYAGEVWDGGNGFDVLVAYASVDLRGMTSAPVITSIEGIGFSDGPNANVRFQIDSTLIDMLSANFVVRGAPFEEGSPNWRVDGLEIDLVAGRTNFDMSSWTFRSWQTRAEPIAYANNIDYLMVNGNAANNTIIGTGRTDRLFGHDGDDVLIGGGGGDLLDGGAGNDRLIGAPGSSFRGGAGFDTVVLTRTDTNPYGYVPVTYEASGIERIEFQAAAGQAVEAQFYLTFAETEALLRAGGAGLQIVGSAGSDRLFLTFLDAHDRVIDLAAFGFQLINLTTPLRNRLNMPGDEVRISATSYYSNPATLRGTNGNDSLAGAAIQYGNDGHDILRGTGPSQLFGGAGDDYVILESLQSWTSGPDVVERIYDGGAGFDFIGIGGDIDLRFLDDPNWGGGYATIRNFEGLAFARGELRAPTLDISAYFTRMMPANLLVEGIDGQEDRISILLRAGDNLDLAPWTFSAWRAADNDHIEIQGTSGPDTITGSSGIDIVMSNGGRDTIRTGAGNDTLQVLNSPGDMARVLDAGAGFDVLHIIGREDDWQRLDMDLRDVTVVSIERLEFGFGSATSTQNVMINASQIGSGFASNLVVSGSSAQDSVQIFVSSGATVNTSGWTFDFPSWSFADYLVYVGDSGNETFIGFPGLDVFFGSPGNDVFDGRGAFDFAAYIFSPFAVTADLAIAGPQFIGGNQGSDTFLNLEGLAGSQLNDVLYGDHQDNILMGMYGNDVLYGRAGNDEIRGYEGSDIIEGGLGADVLYGGAPVFGGADGGDTFRYRNAAEGGDILMDFQPGIDRIEISATGFGGGLVAGGAVTLRVGAAPVVSGGGPQFLYSTNTGELLWDADGVGAGRAVLLATLWGNYGPLAASDIVVTSISGASLLGGDQGDPMAALTNDKAGEMLETLPPDPAGLFGDTFALDAVMSDAALLKSGDMLETLPPDLFGPSGETADPGFADVCAFDTGIANDGMLALLGHDVMAA